MKPLFVVLCLVALGLLVAVPAQAQSMDSCPHEPTVQSLRACVQHAAAQGFIDNAGITRSLLAKLDAAQAAIDLGQPAVAVDTLEAVVRELVAQAGRHVALPHAEHLRMHAELVIQALRQ